MKHNAEKTEPSMTTFSVTLVLFDGECDICNSAARFLKKHDRTKSIKFISRNSDFRSRLLESLPSIVQEADSIIVLQDARFYIKSAAIIHLARFLKWPWNMVTVTRILPLKLSDRLYDLFARKRYLLFRKKKVCRLTTYSRDSLVG